MLAATTTLWSVTDMCLASTPKAPPVAPPPPPAAVEDTMQSNQAARIKRQQQAMTGYQGTVLSGAGGTLGKSVLGG